MARNDAFTAAEVAHYYAVRAPSIRQHGGEWRGPCPIHQGTRDSFAVAPETGLWTCHSQCGRGGSIFDLEMALSETDFKHAAVEVSRIMGRANVGRSRLGRVVAMYDYTDKAGKLLFQCVRYEPKDFRQRRPGGHGGWLWNLKGTRLVLYHLPKIVSAKTVLVVEGERDVHTLESLGYVATCNPMGAGKWRDEYSEDLRGKDVILFGDNDEPGRAHIEGTVHSLAGRASSVRVVPVPTGKDVSDWVAAGATREVIDTAIQASKEIRESEVGPQPAHQDGETRIAPGFTLNERGVFKTGEGDEPKWVCAPLHVVAYARTAEKEEWGKLLRFTDPENCSHEWLLPLSLLAKDTGEFRSRLLSLGLKISAARGTPELLRQYLQMTEPGVYALTVDRIGWHKDTFVLPHETIGPSGREMILFQPEREMSHHLRESGTTLEQWRQHVSRYCSGNSRLLFCVSCAAAAPLLYFLGEHSGGFHLVADTTVGKTTCLIVAGSFWGGGGQNGFIQSWLTTANGLEKTAEWHNHVLLCLDELKLIDPEQASRVAYSLASGQSKGRMGRDMHAQRRPEWQLLFLSTGEIGLASHLEATPQKRLYGGQEVRFCEIPARVDDSGGAFECLHQFESPKAFSEHLKAASRTYYGSACREYLRQLSRMGYDSVRSAVEQHQKRFCERFVPAGIAPEAARAGVRFSLVAAAGELITTLGISGWQPGEAQAAAGACFAAWRAQRGGSGAWDEDQAVRYVKSILIAHGNSRFQLIGEGARQDEIKIVNRIGFRTSGKDAQSEYILVPEMFREVCGPYSEDLVRRALQKRGFLKKGSDPQHTTIKRTLPELGRVRCYVIGGTIFSGDDEEEPAE